MLVYFARSQDFRSRRAAGLTQSRPSVAAAHLLPRRRREGMMKWVIWLYIVAVCAYVFYEWYAYAGLYRLASGGPNT